MLYCKLNYIFVFLRKTATAFHIRCMIDERKGNFPNIHVNIYKSYLIICI